MNRLSLLLFAFTLFFEGNAQTRVVLNPSVAEQSHREMRIDQIMFYTDSTVIDLTIENGLAEGGWFCLDRNTYIEDMKGYARKKIVNAHGISWCPQVYRFQQAGETLNFSLVFPDMAVEAEVFNLVEQCERACFSFRGIILDDKLNFDIRVFDEAMKCYVANKLDQAIELFMNIVEDIPANPTHVYGYSYYHLVQIYLNKGDEKTAQFWFEQLERSGLANRQYFMDAIKREKHFD